MIKITANMKELPKVMGPWIKTDRNGIMARIIRVIKSLVVIPVDAHIVLQEKS